MTVALFACHLGWCLTRLTPAVTPDQCIVLHAKVSGLAPSEEFKCLQVNQSDRP